MPVPLRGTAATKSKSHSTAKSRRDAGATKSKSIPRLAHAGDYYCDVVGLFGCAGPLFGGGYQVFGYGLGVEAALAEDFFAQATDSEFFAVNIFWFGEAVAEGYEEAAWLDFYCSLCELAVFD
jgi:hypothetical protein